MYPRDAAIARDAADFEMRNIYRLAADRDLQLRRVSYRQDTLEEIFLKAMET